MVETVDHLHLVDVAILNALQEDGRMVYADLARHAGMSDSACLRRVKQLEAKGIIERYGAFVDQKAVGLPLNVFLTVTLTSQAEHALREFEADIASVAEVMECFLMTGTADYLIRLVARDVDDLESLHARKLTRLKHVARVTSSIAMRQVVKRSRLPLRP
ncbi:Lrp/AsnC family transcriptional regulator [Sphingomonas sp.]|uniref:Lrp/AsnC family transcriptional regulator n=1 Tax=Sphingomonas sp. TaxID=28214 RepID=UPI000DB284C0|nr:Lrp/AsnC family transcriptional regulator [Sphingomonas sp.]PZU10782.1 MAG: AsnC family transcriptional regulator [Sphingomonas sp.]